MKQLVLCLSTLMSVLLFSQCVNNNTENQDNTHTTMKNIEEVTPPTPKVEEKILSKHGDDRVDNYYWMKLTDEQKAAKIPDTQTQEVLDYLNAENDYTSKMTEDLQDLQEDLFQEITGRIKQNDESVPYKKNGYYYLTRFEEGKEYPIYSRRKSNLKGKDELMIDANVLAKPYDYYQATGLNITPDNKILAYGEDTLSRRKYNIKFKNLETGKYYADVIENTTGGSVWANDNKTLYYTRKDDALRAYKIFRHTMGTPSEQDVEVFHESEETFSCYVYKTKSQKYIVIGSYATVSNEYRILDANDPNGTFKLFQARERNLEHDINHHDGKWYMVTNKDGATNFKVMVTPEDKTTKENWKDFIPHSKDNFITGLEVFKDYLVVNKRNEGMTKVEVIPWDNITSGHYIDFGEDAYTASTSTNPEMDTDIVRLNFTSMTTPGTVYDYNISTKTLELKKRNEVVGDFNPNNYTSERIMVPARDGVEVPVSIVYKNGFKKDGKQPLLLYAYGSYGYSMDPYFSSVRLSLLDRGFAYAIAHIRGGQEMGRLWYEDGKKFNKMNTFNDFIDCGQYLIDNNYTSADNQFCMGGSAGGLLIGAVINMKPDIWKGGIAAVPFVDVVTTMLDETIPLTTGEYDEWGNPNDKEYYDYMKSYSPYDNIKKQDYPALLVTTGYHDSQVQYWEPAKWVAKLREYKTDDNPLLLHTEMSTGHGGKSGRFERYRETALEYAFFLDLAGKRELLK